MASPLGTGPNPTANSAGSPNGSPDGSPRSGKLNNRKVEYIQEGITTEDIEAYERNINEYEKELFERQNMSLKKSQNQTDRMIEAFNMLREAYEDSQKEVSTWKKIAFIVAAIAVTAIIAVIVLAVLF